MLSPLTRCVALHFEAHRGRSKFSFFWRVSAEHFAIQAALLIPLVLMLDVDPRTDLDKLSWQQLVIALVFLAPFFETLLAQAIPIMIARRLRFRFWPQVLCSVPLFAAPHLPSGTGSFIAAGLTGGIYYGFAYAHWRAESFRTAFWMTAGLHSFHNAIVAAGILLSSTANEPNKAPEPTTMAVTPRATSGASK